MTAVPTEPGEPIVHDITIINGDPAVAYLDMTCPCGAPYTITSELPNNAAWTCDICRQTHWFTINLED